jgi:hypothetical protein
LLLSGSFGRLHLLLLLCWLTLVNTRRRRRLAAAAAQKWSRGAGSVEQEEGDQ